MTATKIPVVTWQSPGDNAIEICRECEAKLTAEHAWPKDGAGREYCQVSRGEHSGYCEIDDCQS